MKGSREMKRWQFVLASLLCPVLIVLASVIAGLLGAKNLAAILSVLAPILPGILFALITFFYARQICAGRSGMIAMLTVLALFALVNIGVFVYLVTRPNIPMKAATQATDLY